MDGSHSLGNDRLLERVPTEETLEGYVILIVADFVLTVVCAKKWIVKKIHPCGSDVMSELQHRSLCGRNETRTVKRAIRKIRQSPEQANGNPVGDTAGSVRRATGMETFDNYCALIT